MQTAHRLCNSRFSWAPANPSRRAQQNGRNKRHSVPNSDPGQNADSRSAAALGAVELPGGVLWWHDKQHSVYKHDVVYGQDFVLQRPRSGGPGLVLSQRLSSMQIVDKAERARVQLEMYNASQSSTGVQLFKDDVVDFDLTDYALVEESNLDMPGDAEPEQFPPTACLGIVLRNQPEEAPQQAAEQVTTSHSRRTKAVRYTCKMCGTTSLKAVNPHAWATGTVFGRCDGCQVIHKLTDNLELFHELSGSVLDKPADLSGVKIPDSLSQKPYMP